MTLRQGRLLNIPSISDFQSIRNVAKLSAILLIAVYIKNCRVQLILALRFSSCSIRFKGFLRYIGRGFVLRLGFPRLSRFSSFHTDPTTVISSYDLREYALSTVQDSIPSLPTFKLHSNCLIVCGFLLILSFLHSLSFSFRSMPLCQCFFLHRSPWGAECAILGIPSLTGYQHHQGIHS